MTADEVITLLGLAPHPEGGWFRQTWEAGAASGTRAAGTCIYYLLGANETSRWHRVDSAEIWHFYAGVPLTLRVAETESGPARASRLRPDLAAGRRPQVLVPPGHWQSAETTGAWTLVGCTVSPGFRYEGFELAAPDFEIPG